MAGFSNDPWGWVQYAFPWGENELEGKSPEAWQEELLKQVSAGLITWVEAIQIAVSSGHGVGKTALVAWLILWAMSTYEDCRGIVTANTKIQLETKTWPELSKWHRLFIAGHWFTVTSSSIFSVDPKHTETWRIDAIPWDLKKPEAFAGLHNHKKRILIIFDEASAIPDKIHEVTEGAETDKETEIMWFMFGNPTRNSGRFHAAFHRMKHRWITHQVDARKVTLSDKKKIEQWANDYGEDSDFFKVRVTGEFPSTGERQFISSKLVDTARGKHLKLDAYNFAPVILSCEPAWTGGDEIVIAKRQGLASSILLVLKYNDDDAEVAARLAQFEDEHDADAVFVDLGYGTGIYSFGKQMKRRWTLVAFGSKSSKAGYLNKRAEMWGDMKDWLKEGAAIPDDAILVEEIPGPEFEITLKGQIVLESKDDMKARGLSSPNRADAIALTFAMPVRKKMPHEKELVVAGQNKPEFAHSKYKLFGK